MAYKIIYSKNTVRDIKKLDPVVKKKIGKAIVRFSQNPLKFARKITSPTAGKYRWRAGNYRIIFDLSGKRIEILRLGHRKDIYRK